VAIFKWFLYKFFYSSFEHIELLPSQLKKLKDEDEANLSFMCGLIQIKIITLLINIKNFN